MKLTLGLVGSMGALLYFSSKRHSLHCVAKSAAQRTAEGLEKIYEEPYVPSTPAELEAFLQDQSKAVGKIPTFATINAALKSITALDTVSGFKIDLSAQASKHFQLGGTWAYSKTGGSFSLNTALLADALVQDASFIAATYHDNGKMESRGLLKLDRGFGIGAEVMFQGQDTRRAYYTIELSKSFEDCTLS